MLLTVETVVFLAVSTVSNVKNYLKKTGDLFHLTMVNFLQPKHAFSLTIANNRETRKVFFIFGMVITGYQNNRPDLPTTPKKAYCREKEKEDRAAAAAQNGGSVRGRSSSIYIYSFPLTQSTF